MMFLNTISLLNKRMKIFVFFIFAMIFSIIAVPDGISFASTIWCNPANSGTENGFTKTTGYNTLWEAMAAMSSGDTIIIANGNWVSSSNMSINGSHSPISGTSNSYSKIKAENDWGVRLPNIYVESPRSYIEIRGIVFDSRAALVGNIVFDWNHTKFIRCGFLLGKVTGNMHTCGFGSGDSTRSKNQYNLMEECIAWGGGRYVFYSKYGKYNVFRRCIARHDNQEGGTNPNDDGQIFNFRAYACDYHAYQNCISIDSDRIANYNSGNLQPEAGGFWIGDSYGSTGCELDGCISIKDVQMPYYLAGSENNLGTITIKNCIALNPTPGADTLNAFFLKAGSNVNASNLLGMGALSAGQDGFYGKKEGAFAVSNSIVKDVADNGVFGATNSYINYYNAGTGAYGTGSISSDPETKGLLYPVRIEKESLLSTSGSGGEQIGATILKKIGRDADGDGICGLLYGEEGWNELQDGSESSNDENLWPFPNEDTIKTLMSTTVDGVSGVYGFTAGVHSLTEYIWGYLGNTLPPFQVRANGRDQAVRVGWFPNRYDADVIGYNIYKITRDQLGKINGYTLLKNTSDDLTEGAHKHVDITGLTNGVKYEFVVRTVTPGGESGDSYEVSATPSANTPPPPNP